MSPAPHIAVELVLTRSRLDLLNREADIAVRPSSQPPEALAGRRLCGFGFKVYAARDYLDARDAELSGTKAPHPTASHQWVCLDRSMLDSPPGRWTREHVPETAIRLRADSHDALLHAAQCGLGLALLPCCIVEPTSNLVEVNLDLPRSHTDLWLLMHPDLRQVGRIRAFADFLAERIGAAKDRIEG